jgi:N-methylhydantoinase B
MVEDVRRWDVADGIVVTRADGERRYTGAATADAISTEVIRGGVTSAAELMKVALCRTSHSPLIYEMVDFSCALFDADVRLLAQAEALPIFLGTMGFCTAACVRAVGGPEALEPGDVLLSTAGYDNGSHANDVAVVAPVFEGGVLVGYASVKAHLMDVGAKQPFCNDTTDIFQEGVIIPGVKLYRRGELVEDVQRIFLANSRVPAMVAGDLHAEVTAATTGARALQSLIRRFGLERFRANVEAMLDHGEAVVRAFLADVPDGRYASRASLDSDGVTDVPIVFDVELEVAGSDVLVDFSGSPGEQVGPVNCPLPATVSGARLAIISVAGRDLPLNEGCLRPIAVATRPRSLFHPAPPAPIFLYAWPVIQAIDAAHAALAAAIPDRVPAPSGGDIGVIIWWGGDGSGEVTWTTGTDHFCGQGATRARDGSAPLMHISCSGIRNTPAEVLEQRFPLVVRQYALAPDSGGAGRTRGGLGTAVDYELRADAFATLTFEHTLEPAGGLDGGGASSLANSATVVYPDGSERGASKVTGLALPAGTTVRVRMGGGGGCGPAAERDPEAVAADRREGYVT